jgi:hypothetical protein
MDKLVLLGIWCFNTILGVSENRGYMLQNMCEKNCGGVELLKIGNFVFSKSR